MDDRETTTLSDDEITTVPVSPTAMLDDDGDDVETTDVGDDMDSDDQDADADDA